MKLRFKRTICDYFSDIKDPRLERRKRHKLIDIITITICAIISGVQQGNRI
ncbi:transposase (plasmid) [Gloeothece citriformis PCC 7424]|uniref:Transposase n=1 Tax=Gloeothece citriformis (strain PCC 7424) TaxID=65393 RepID=B7KLN3_GLOC7|nr:transposase [Gloeothece citriformis PCC 7424]ACK73889.1 transposase [Gloeothece citriformis PCC 7424]